MVHSLRPDHIAEYYPFLRDMLVRACRDGGADPIRLFQDGVEGNVTFWLVLDDRTPKGLIVSRIEAWPEGAVCRVVCASGREMASWLNAALETLSDHARANGCARMVTEGRKGWGKVLGVKPVRYVFEKEIA